MTRGSTFRLSGTRGRQVIEHHHRHRDAAAYLSWRGGAAGDKPNECDRGLESLLRRVEKQPHPGAVRARRSGADAGGRFVAAEGARLLVFARSAGSGAAVGRLGRPGGRTTPCTHGGRANIIEAVPRRSCTAACAVLRRGYFRGQTLKWRETGLGEREVCIEYYRTNGQTSGKGGATVAATFPEV